VSDSGLAARRLLRELAAPRVAARAGVDLGARRARSAALRVAGLRIGAPCDSAPLVELHGEAAVRDRIPTGLALRPCQVASARTVAALAADAHLDEPAGVAARRGVVVLLESDRMTLGAHVVPVLAAPRPVQHVAIVDLLARIQVVPALAAGFLRPCVPGDPERLYAAAVELDQVLLQRVHAERVADRVVVQRAVGAVGRDEITAVARAEGRRHVAVLERRAAEVAELGRRGRVLHRELVLRAAPRLGFLRVTARARGAPRVLCRAGWSRGGLLLRGRAPPPQAADHHQRRDRAGGEHAGSVHQRSLAREAMIAAKPGRLRSGATSNEKNSK
jgi:hypothetical protein